MMNPVLRREMRSSLRTWKTYVIIAVYDLFLVAVAGLSLLAFVTRASYNGFNPQNTIMIYNMLTGFQLGLVMLIVPAMTGGAISGERERQTLDLMLVTKMSSFSILFGKLISSLLLVLLIIASSVPVFAIMSYYGGVSVFDMLGMAVLTMFVALMSGSISILFSTLFKKTVGAVVVTYIILLVLNIGTLIFYLFMYWLLEYYWSKEVPLLISYMIGMTNPFMGFLSMLDTQTGTSTINDMFSVYYRSSAGFNIFVIPLWIANMFFQIVVTFFAVYLAGKKLRSVKM